MDKETADCILKLDDQIKHLWNSLKYRAEAEEYERAAREWREKAEALDKQIREYKNELATHIKSVNEESSRYVNIVSVIGYAGYFTTWGFTRDILGREATIFVASMGMASVSLFVLWEMFAIYMRLKSVGMLGQMFRNSVSVEAFEELRAQLLSDEARTTAIINPVHKVVFIVSFAAAIAGGLAMMQKLYMSL
ncbi:hypothetical protein AB3G45_16645 [Shinella sp. S4-D37]|uniref:hypothetical protein n=1 Tax=Shinella sp. S4-D37 TaxID=3161999 RepID=UPI003466D963